MKLKWVLKYVRSVNVLNELQMSVVH